MDQLNAIQARHANVRDDSIEAAGADEVQGFLAVGSFDDGTAETTKPGRKDFAHVGFIVGDQDTGIFPGK